MENAERERKPQKIGVPGLEELQALVGKEMAEVVCIVIFRLKARWSNEYAARKRRSLARKRWVYLWTAAFIRASEPMRCGCVCWW